ncbi:hypothetical protein ACWEKR_34640 [Nocardia sp. NPDC004573]
MEFDHLASLPEVNTSRLLSGSGAVAQANIAASHAGLAGGAAVAASETDCLTVMMGVAGEGPASQWLAESHRW